MIVKITFRDNPKCLNWESKSDGIMGKACFVLEASGTLVAYILYYLCMVSYFFIIPIAPDTTKKFLHRVVSSFDELKTFVLFRNKNELEYSPAERMGYKL